MIEIDMSEEELKESFLAVEDGTWTGEEAFANTMIWQRKNKQSKKVQ